MISGHSTIADAVQALRAGAFDFLEKPLARDKVLVVVKNAIEQASLKRENERFREIVGDGPKMIGLECGVSTCRRAGDARGPLGCARPS